jgi:hypothetical protein
MRRLGIVLLTWLAPSAAFAQPTYKLDVKADLQPRAVLTLAGDRISRSALSDDPGFRLQYHFKKDGKSLLVVEARSKTAVEALAAEPGVYAVVLELFYPNYKGGNVTKGEFRAVSSVLVYRVEAGTPPRRVLLPPRDSPALELMFGALYLPGR